MEIRLDNVVVSGERGRALDGVRLLLGPGAHALVLGPSGAGKTVLLKVIAGLLPPTSGRVLWDGEDAYSLPAAERRRAQGRFGMVFQSDALFDSLSVRSNVELPLRNRGVGEKEAREQARRALEAVGLEDAELKRPEELSGGMKKRAGIARAVVARPEVLLADDPLAGLDPFTAQQIGRLLARESEGRTLISAMPDPGGALAAGRWIVLDRGQIAYDSPPR